MLGEDPAGWGSLKVAPSSDSDLLQAVRREGLAHNLNGRVPHSAHQIVLGLGVLGYL